MNFERDALFYAGFIAFIIVWNIGVYFLIVSQENEKLGVSEGEWISESTIIENYSFEVISDLFSEHNKIIVQTAEITKQYSLNDELYVVEGKDTNFILNLNKYMVQSGEIEEIAVVEVPRNRLRDFSAEYLEALEANVKIYTYDDLDEIFNKYKKYDKELAYE